MVGTLRFGWSGAGHAAINNQAFDFLGGKPSSLATFLAAEEEAIHDVSTLQDRKFSGRAHFLHAENLWRDDFPKKLSQEARQFKKVTDFFDAANRKSYVKAFVKAMDGVEDGCCDPPDNVYHSVIKNYNELVQEFKAAAKLSGKGSVPVSGRKRKETRQKLVDTLGRLSHYATDMCQPMHNTLFYNWRLPISYKNSHGFFENRLFNKAAYDDWKADLGDHTPVAMDENTRRAEIHDVLKTGYRAMFDIVKTDKAARDHLPDKGRYVEQLKKTWRPIAAERMEEGAKLLANLIHSAYEEAGRPNLDLLA